MNKYEEFALQYSGYVVYADPNLRDFIQIHEKHRDGSFAYLKDTNYKVRIPQSENYNIKKYFLRFQTAVAKVIADGKEYDSHEIEHSSHPSPIIPIDFDHKIKTIQLCFDGALDPITVELEYVESDKASYDNKLQAQKEAEYEKLSEIKTSTGKDLVNVYFKPCCDDYKKASIELYTANEKRIIIGIGHDSSSKIETSIGQLIGKFEVDEGMFFKSINGLARGPYGIKLIQFDKKGKQLFKSNPYYFKIIA